MLPSLDPSLAFGALMLLSELSAMIASASQFDRRARDLFQAMGRLVNAATEFQQLPGRHFAGVELSGPLAGGFLG